MQPYTKTDIASIIKDATPRPKIELTQVQLDRLKTAGEILLAIVGAAGIMTVALVAPNALQAFKAFGKKEGKRWMFKERQRKLGRSFYYLKEQNYIEFAPKGKDLRIHLTDKGRSKLKLLKLATLQVKKPIFWDGKFWQVAADIPVDYKRAAGSFRDKLKRMGFYSLQRTLWFYPYDPRKEIGLLTGEYKIDRFVTIMKIASLDYSDRRVLKDHFRKIGILAF